MKAFLRGLYDMPHFGKRMILCFVAVVFMGFGVSWLSFIGWGTDPCSVMNFAISEKIGWSFGNWQAFLNVLLFLIVIWRDKKKIGFGTLFNMFVVGYACDFMTWLRNRLWPDLTLDLIWVKILVMLVVLAIFVFAAAVYMSVELGTAPYDALPYIISDLLPKVNFRWVRIAWDVTMTIIGICIGGIFSGKFGVVTAIMAFALGPVIGLVGEKIKPFIE